MKIADDSSNNGFDVLKSAERPKIDEDNAARPHKCYKDDIIDEV